MIDDDSDNASTAVPNRHQAPQTGYKNPPAAHQFKKGKSGNPRGRPKATKDKRQFIEKVLLERHEIVEGGRKVIYTTLELILIALRNKTFDGHSRAFKVFETLSAKYNPQPAATPAGCLVVPGHLSKAVWQALFQDYSDPTQEE